jgi:predicted ATPase
MGYNWDINFRPDDVNNIVRTNCDHFLNGVRVAVKEGKFDPKDIEIKFWSPKEKNLQILSIDKDGRIGLWPRGFFDEWETALMELL